MTHKSIWLFKTIKIYQPDVMGKIKFWMPSLNDSMASTKDAWATQIAPLWRMKSLIPLYYMYQNLGTFFGWVFFFFHLLMCRKCDKFPGQRGLSATFKIYPPEEKCAIAMLKIMDGWIFSFRKINQPVETVQGFVFVRCLHILCRYQFLGTYIHISPCRELAACPKCDLLTFK